MKTKLSNSTEKCTFSVYMCIYVRACVHTYMNNKRDTKSRAEK